MACHNNPPNTETDSGTTESATDSTTQTDSATQTDSTTLTDSTTQTDSHIIDTETSSNIDEPKSTDSTTETSFDSDTTEDTDSQEYQIQSVDILFVVDNSRSMAEEQKMLGSAIFSLINPLINPLPTWPYPGASDVRIGVVTSDMGVQYDGNPYTGKFNVDPKCITPPLGDNGALISNYLADQIDILDNTIACDASAVQCPSGWNCISIDNDSVGVCKDPNGDGSMQYCPLAPEEYGEQTITLENWKNSDMAFSTACLTSVGTQGCNFEQPLVAAAAGLELNADFIRPNSLSVIIVISDEDDCSIKSSEFHDLPEFTSTNLNMTCGLHPDVLFNIEELKSRYEAVKQTASSGRSPILFAAIVGVPMVDSCQGKGNTLDNCLSTELPKGGTVGNPAAVDRPDSQGNMSQYFEYACTRSINENDVTNAYPGSRFVQMAQSFGEMGYIYSICNENWNAAMENIAEMIVKEIN